MAQTRKDLRGRILRKGEMQRASDKRYSYSYTDPLVRRKFIYAKDLITCICTITLSEKVSEIS